MSKVSIIVPIYNVEKYVEKCIKSLINQTFKDIEIWAISDGSPDNSIEIVKEFAKQDSRVKCIEKENGGYGSVLEYAIAKIQTEYFLICDPDDWLEEDAIEKLYKCAEENNVDLVVGEKYLVYKEEKNKKFENGFSVLYPIEPNKVYTNLECFVFFEVCPHAKLYKTNLAKKIKFPHKVSYTDMVLYLVYLINIDKVIYLDIPLANYFYDRPGNTMGEIEKGYQKAFDAQMIVYNSILDQLDKTADLNSIICYRLYALVFSVAKSMKKDVAKNQLMQNKKEIIRFLSKLKMEKKNINKYIKSQNFLKTIVKKMIFHLLFCDLTREITLNCIIAFAKK